MTSSDDNRPSQESRRWALKASGRCVLVTILFLVGYGASKPPLYSVGGTVTGLKGSGLVLQSPGLPDVPLSTNESFLIANAVPTGFSYAATVKVQPVNPHSAVHDRRRIGERSTVQCEQHRGDLR